MSKRTLPLLALAVVVLSMITSCSGDDTTFSGGGTGSAGGDNKLVVYIGMVPSKEGRAAFASDPGLTAEAHINNATIGVFGGDGTAKLIREVVPQNQKIELTVPNLETGDSVFLAINVPAGRFSDVVKKKQFKEKTLNIDEAMIGEATDKTKPNVTNTPMFGLSDLKASANEAGERIFTSTVPVNHLLCKVTLNNITSSLKGNATFTPTEVYLKDVPEYLDFYPATSASKGDYKFYDNTNGTFYQGEAATSGATDYKAYLGSGSRLPFVPTNPTLSSHANFWHNNTPALVFYTMPNTSGRPTKMVIKGIYKRDGESTYHEVYYSLFLNHNSNSSQIPNGGKLMELYPNYNYIVDVVIKAEGSSTPGQEVDPDDVINYFEKVYEDYTFGVLGGYYANYDYNIEEYQNDKSGKDQGLDVNPPTPTDNTENNQNGSTSGIEANTNENGDSQQDDTSGTNTGTEINPPAPGRNDEDPTFGSQDQAGTTTEPNGENNENNGTGNTGETDVIPPSPIDDNENQQNGSTSGISADVTDNGDSNQNENSGTNTGTVVNPPAPGNNEENPTYGSQDHAGTTTEPNGENNENNGTGNTGETDVVPPSPDQSTENLQSGSTSGVNAEVQNNGESTQEATSGTTSGVEVNPPTPGNNQETPVYGEDQATGTTTEQNGQNTENNTSGEIGETEVIPPSPNQSTEEQQSGSTSGVNTEVQENGNSSQEATSGTTSGVEVTPPTPDQNQETPVYGENQSTGATTEQNGENTENNKSGKTSGTEVIPPTPTDNTENQQNGSTGTDKAVVIPNGENKSDDSSGEKSSLDVNSPENPTTIENYTFGN